MARSESDREDLLREATALKRRAELRIDSLEEPIVIGFRSEGAASFYAGQDLVFQFNSAGQIRRGFTEGLLLKAVEGRLYSLRRVRSPQQVELQRHALTSDQEERYAQAWQKLRHQVRDALQSGTYQLVGQHPPDADLPAEILCWLDSMPEELHPAQGPGVA